MATVASTSGAQALVVTALDEVAWLFNLRGGDVPKSPLFKAFAIIEQTEARYVKTAPVQVIHNNRVLPVQK